MATAKAEVAAGAASRRPCACVEIPSARNREVLSVPAEQRGMSRIQWDAQKTSQTDQLR